MLKFTSSVQNASEQLVETFKQLVPLQPVPPKGSHAVAAEGQSKSNAEPLAKFYECARAERTRLGLGVIGLARLAFGVQQRLLAAGYPPQMVKQVLFAMLTSAFVGKQR